MEIRQFFILLLVFTVITISGGIFLSNIGKNYGIQIEQVGTMKTVNEIGTEMESFETQLRESKTGISLVDVPFMIVSGAYTVIKLSLLKIPDLWMNLINDMGGFLGIPSWASSTIVVILITTLIFEILSILFKWKV
ncbi:MAG: hypothetical protein QW228_05965 [Candidatus Aenigmatarchaeota archaeon]